MEPGRLWPTWRTPNGVRAPLPPVAAEDNPTLVAFDQDAWARNLDYARRKPKQSLESFRRIRAENYELLKGLPEAAFERTGNHTESGPHDASRM